MSKTFLNKSNVLSVDNTFIYFLLHINWHNISHIWYLYIHIYWEEYIILKMLNIKIIGKKYSLYVQKSPKLYVSNLYMRILNAVSADLNTSSANQLTYNVMLSECVLTSRVSFQQCFKTTYILTLFWTWRKLSISSVSIAKYALYFIVVTGVLVMRYSQTSIPSGSNSAYVWHCGVSFSHYKLCN